MVCETAILELQKNYYDLLKRVESLERKTSAHARQNLSVDDCQLMCGDPANTKSDVDVSAGCDEPLIIPANTDDRECMYSISGSKLEWLIHMMEIKHRKCEIIRYDDHGVDVLLSGPLGPREHVYFEKIDDDIND